MVTVPDPPDTANASTPDLTGFQKRLYIDLTLVALPPNLSSRHARAVVKELRDHAQSANLLTPRLFERVTKTRRARIREMQKRHALGPLVDLTRPRPTAFTLLADVGAEAVEHEFALDLCHAYPKFVESLRPEVDRLITLPPGLPLRLLNRKRGPKGFKYVTWGGKPNRKIVADSPQGTLYVNSRCVGDPASGFRLIVYSDEESKVATGTPCVHAQLAPFGRTILDLMDLRDPEHLARLDLLKLFREHLAFAEVRPLEELEREFVAGYQPRSDRARRLSDRRLAHFLRRTLDHTWHDSVSAFHVQDRCRWPTWPRFEDMATLVDNAHFLPRIIRNRSRRLSEPRPAPHISITTRRRRRARTEPREFSAGLLRRMTEHIPPPIPSHRGGRPPRTREECLLAALALASGAMWTETGLPRGTLHGYLQAWRADGTLKTLHARFSEDPELVGLDWQRLLLGIGFSNGPGRAL
jgi:hypothetical protein